MREIKFRAWDKENKKMLSPETLLKRNYFINSLTGKIRFDTDNSCSDPDCCGGPFPQWEDNDDLIVLQYTGLKDKNGKEIYEGDIIEATAKLQGFVMCVIWDSQDAGWRVNYYNGTKPIQDWLCMYQQLEVIGNIYQHPHLLKDSK